jgi:hypothetical protein
VGEYVSEWIFEVCIKLSVYGEYSLNVIDVQKFVVCMKFV